MSLHLIDTHCHIHDKVFAQKYDVTQDELISRATKAGVREFICVGTDVPSSRQALEFCKTHPNTYPTLAIHPHEAANFTQQELKEQMAKINELVDDSVVAIGECGLDYYYHHDAQTKKAQEWLFRQHIELALKLDLPIIFHVRDAFDDFFRIIDEYEGIRGVVHSFSAHNTELKGVIDRHLYVGLNGIMTFTKDEKQLEVARHVPLKNLVLETDAPFLTPKPFRGTMCEPKHVINITQFLSELRGESRALLAEQTTKNAKKLFKL